MSLDEKYRDWRDKIIIPPETAKKHPVREDAIIRMAVQSNVKSGLKVAVCMATILGQNRITATTDEALAFIDWLSEQISLDIPQTKMFGE